MAEAPSPWQVYHAVRDALGDAAALRVIQVAGGERVFVPRTAHGSRLAGRLGLDITAVLSGQWPGETLTLPSRGAINDRARAAERRRAVLSSPDSINTLARELSISTRRVEQIRAEGRAGQDARQADLFPGVQGKQNR